MAAFSPVVKQYIGYALCDPEEHCQGPVCRNVKLGTELQHLVSVSHGGTTKNRANTIIDVLIKLMRRVGFAPVAEQRVEGDEQGQRRPGDIAANINWLQRKVLIDHTFFHPGALSRSSDPEAPAGHYAWKAERGKLKQLVRAKKLSPVDLASIQPSKDQVERLWTDGFRFIQGYDGQYFWPIGSELYGAHGPCMNHIIRVVAQQFQDRYGEKRTVAEKKIRIAISKLIHDDLGRTLIDLN